MNDAYLVVVVVVQCSFIVGVFFLWHFLYIIKPSIHCKLIRTKLKHTAYSCYAHIFTVAVHIWERLTSLMAFQWIGLTNHTKRKSEYQITQSHFILFTILAFATLALGFFKCNFYINISFLGFGIEFKWQMELWAHLFICELENSNKKNPIRKWGTYLIDGRKINLYANDHLIGFWRNVLELISRRENSRFHIDTIVQLQ